ncbi:aminoglycoside 3'-phosphotransferase [Microlunatus ginsengisoli]|uniref:Aminoglycoside 3'-phosphotransferase n=1 Tax=Microlunatus ginsengisoli TaxID=363863 RepID=A0ABP6ZAU8_9ACTN
MTIPVRPVDVPASVRELARREGLGTGHAVWLNQLGGLTFAYPDVGQFVKWVPHHPEFDVVDEAARLDWAGRFTTVPAVIDLGSDEHGAWLRTRAVPGRSAVHPRWIAEPRIAVRAIGTGLRSFHDRLPVLDCPFDWSLATRFAWIKRDEDRVLIEQAPPIDRLVVCHGDMCAPNTLLDEAGAFTGHVDLGRLGVADRWADLAVATYSLGWNYDGEWTDELLDAYGIERDDDRIGYYRRLWDAT